MREIFVCWFLILKNFWKRFSLHKKHVLVKWWHSWQHQGKWVEKYSRSFLMQILFRNPSSKFSKFSSFSHANFICLSNTFIILIHCYIHLELFLTLRECCRVKWTRSWWFNNFVIKKVAPATWKSLLFVTYQFYFQLCNNARQISSISSKLEWNMQLACYWKKFNLQSLQFNWITLSILHLHGGGVGNLFFCPSSSRLDLCITLLLTSAFYVQATVKNMMILIRDAS